MSKNSKDVYNTVDQEIESHMGLVIAIVNSFNPNNDTERQDMIDAGRIGLWKGLEKYNKKRGTAISTFVWSPIRWSIIKEIKQSRNNNIALDKIADPYCEIPENVLEYINEGLCSEEEIAILKLRIKGYKFREICVKMNKTSSQVKNTFYRIIKKIKKNYNES